MSCKCVCKSWRSLIETPEFVKRHFSRSAPGLTLFEEQGETGSRLHKVLEFVDTKNFVHHPCKRVLDFSFSDHRARAYSSANGLLMLWNPENRFDLFICNPVTHEYIKLPPRINEGLGGFEFGMSRLNCEYKVVVWTPRCINRTAGQSHTCEVYTLGTGSWRSVAVDGKHGGCFVYVNGKLYSLGWEYCSRTHSLSEWISCFDLDTELFTTLSCPSSAGYRALDCPHLRALGDCLSLCHNDFDELIIWLMSEHGHWRKGFVIPEKRYFDRCNTFSAIKVYKDGDLLLAMETNTPCCGSLLEEP